MLRLDNKTAIITGGGSGIGKATSLLFASQGANIAILDIDTARSTETVEQINTSGGKAIAVVCNVSNQESVEKAFETVVSAFGSIDILVNNAGIAHIGNLENTHESDFDKVYQVNVKGYYLCMQAAVKQFLRQGGGVIANVCSIASVVGISDRFAYSMSKGAALTMTLSVARDYIDKNIRCNCISPGRVHTPFVDNFLKNSYPGQETEMFSKLSATQPIGRMGTPEEIANLILYLFRRGCFHYRL